MLSAIEQSRLRDDRAMIFTNLLNGATIQQVGKAFNRKSEDDVLQVFFYILLKIKVYLFARCQPMPLCSSISEAQKEKVMLLGILPKLNLDLDPKLKKPDGKEVNVKKIIHEKIDHNNAHELHGAKYTRSAQKV